MSDEKLWDALNQPGIVKLQGMLEDIRKPKVDVDAELAAYRKWLDGVRRDEIFPVQLAELAWLERASRG